MPWKGQVQSAAGPNCALEALPPPPPLDEGLRPAAPLPFAAYHLSVLEIQALVVLVAGLHIDLSGGRRISWPTRHASGAALAGGGRGEAFRRAFEERSRERERRRANACVRACVFGAMKYDSWVSQPPRGMSESRRSDLCTTRLTSTLRLTAGGHWLGLVRIFIR